MAHIAILGDGGHARVLADAASLQYGPLNFDLNIRRLGRDIEPSEIESLIAGVGDQRAKRELVAKYGGDRFIEVRHPSAIIAATASIGLAPQIMAGAIIQPGAVIGDHVLINTGAQIDHDCHVGDYCFIGPGAVLCGDVTLGAGCFIGAGATIVPGVTVAAEEFIRAGELVK